VGKLRDETMGEFLSVRRFVDRFCFDETAQQSQVLSRQKLASWNERDRCNGWMDSAGGERPRQFRQSLLKTH